MLGLATQPTVLGRLPEHPRLFMGISKCRLGWSFSGNPAWAASNAGFSNPAYPAIHGNKHHVGWVGALRKPSLGGSKCWVYQPSLPRYPAIHGNKHHVGWVGALRKPSLGGFECWVYQPSLPR
jgi:hypothetical protein